MATDYQRGYNKGRSTGDRKIAEMREQYSRELNDAISRAERAESGIGLGQCKDCRLWTRNEHCFWGLCNVGEHGMWTTDSNIWARAEAPRVRDSVKIYTSESFGCVLWRPLLSKDNGQ